MSTATRTDFHWSPLLQRYNRCQAKLRCPYGGAHTSLAGIAQAGGAVVSTHGHKEELIVSPVVAGAFSVGNEKRRQTFREDGTKLDHHEAARWRIEIAKRSEDEPVQTRLEPTLLPALGWGTAPVQARPTTPRQTHPKEFELAEKSTDPGVLAMLASSADPAVRLVVARNPAATTDTLEGLALSEDNGWKVYRLAALEELGFRYQDERDAAELEACSRMERDGVLPKLATSAPAAAVVATIPQRAWHRKPQRARRSLISRAVDQLARMMGKSLKLAGWTRNRVLKSIIGKNGMRLIYLPSSIAKDLHIREVTGWMLDFFGSLEGDAKAQARVRRKLARSFGLA
ncbi:hypothetical protein [Microbacterium sp. UCD-TDU]|uniref:hypothetical protein n=1 Tax=Microbacterium sp. UCD-TDU TaxID=1247714 RepID=UPI001181B797|nr:hypothetical protein [Microbacterium sp. UCD-TDU]